MVANCLWMRKYMKLNIFLTGIANGQIIASLLVAAHA